MHISASRFRLSTAFVGAVALSACSGSDPGVTGDPAPIAGNNIPATDQLIGTWTFSGQVPARVDVTLTFNADQTFTWVEQVAPSSQPAGFVSDGCLTTDTMSAAYAETLSVGMPRLIWTFTGGTTNAVSGCGTASNDSPGTAMTSADVDADIAEGLFPPTTDPYSVTSSTLVLSNASGIAMTFQKAD